MIEKNRIFIEALAQHKVAEFLVGEDPFFYDAKNDNEEPQNIRQAFDVLIFPLWMQTGDTNIPKALTVGLLEILQKHPDKNRAIYVSLDWMAYYSYCHSKQQKEPNGYFKGLFELDLTEVISLLRKLIGEQKDSLILDTRWAGAKWNSKRGLLDPIIRMAEMVKSLYGGMSCLPGNVL